MSLSKDLEVQSFDDVKNIQDEMSRYNVKPELFTAVTNKLLAAIEC